MAAAQILLEDMNGSIACKLVFSGGFDPQSHAHQHAQILIGMMDDLCTKQDELLSVDTAKPEAPAIILASG